jgi:hypothetical protein
VGICGKWKKIPLAPFLKGELPPVLIQKLFKNQTGLDFKKI